MSDLTYNEYLKYNINEYGCIFLPLNTKIHKKKLDSYISIEYNNGMHELDPEINQLVSEHFDELLL